MVSSIFYKRISLRFRVHFAFGVSENTTKYVDIIRMISSIPSLTPQGYYCTAQHHPLHETVQPFVEPFL
jgi:hypothetical protein